MNGIDYMGPQGGALGMAFGAGFLFASGALLTAGAFIWKMLFNPRLNELKEQLSGERSNHEETIRQERESCQRQIDALRDRITQLETLLIANGPAQLRQAVQAVVSETRVDADARRAP